MKTDDTLAATQKDLTQIEERIRSDMIGMEERIIRQFGVIAEGLRHDLARAKFLRSSMHQL